MSTSALETRLNAVNHRITKACQHDDQQVRLLAVSKTKPLADIITLYQAGQRHFAENYAQEGVDKVQQAAFDDAQWHFIGPLQSNKTKLIAEHFDWVHTIDREKIARRLSDQRPTDKAALNALIQVNISQDPAKSGVNKAQAVTLAKQMSLLPNIKLRGLMTILEAQLSPAQRLAQFQELKSLQQALIKEHPDCTELSMGMSGDFELAIQAGATMVRVGSDIFGPRNVPT